MATKTTKITNNYSQLYKRSPIYDEYIKKSLHSVYNWTIGSVRSGKSITNILAFCTNLMLSPEKLHAAVGVSVATARAILFDSGGLGIRHFFRGYVREGKYDDRDALIITINGDEKVVFAFGGANADDYKNIRGLSLGSIIATEVDLLHETFMEEMIRRTLASKRRQYFFDNNAASPYARIYSDDAQYSIDRLLLTVPDKVNFMTTSIFDNPSLTKEQVEDVLKEYDPNSLQYKRYILNQRIIAEDLVYTIYDWNIQKTFNPRDIIDYVISIDVGENSSATSMVAIGITKGNEKLIVFNEYYHINKNKKGLAIKSYNDYANDAIDFIDRNIKAMNGVRPRQIYIDHSITFQRELREALNKRGQYNTTFKYAIKDEVEERIKTHINLLWTKKLSFTENCTMTLKAFRESQYDPQKAVKGKYVYLDKPGITNIDPVDATAYGINHFVNLVYRK
jgi:PBSX family phage terminase large subunit